MNSYSCARDLRQNSSCCSSKCTVDFPRRIVKAEREADYPRYSVGSMVDEFLPIPGDVLITNTPRPPFVASYLGPNPGGNTTIFVDRNYFDRDQNAREEMEVKMPIFFEPNDVIIRFGKFHPGWRWKPHGTIEVFQRRIPNGYNPGSKCYWYFHSRLTNSLKLGPPVPFDEVYMVQNRASPPCGQAKSFAPRTADIIIRPSTKESTYIDRNYGMPEFQTGDFIVRLSIEKVRSDQYYKLTVDMYMFQKSTLPALPRRSFQPLDPEWIFRGRDVQLFGPPRPDHRGFDQVLDLNSIEPHVRRAIPHW